MSLIPMIMDWTTEVDPWFGRSNIYPFSRSSYMTPSLFDQSFGWDIHPRDLRQMMMVPSQLRRQLSTLTQDNELKVPTIGKDGFQVCLDVAQFKPNEISVKTIENSIIVEGKHEERQDDHGYISRQFTRKYVLPKNYDPNTVVSSLSSDGVLSIKAPLPQKSTESNERIISIQQTGPAKASIKPNPEHDDEKKK